MKEICLRQFEFQITPEDYLKELFAHTEDGVLFLAQEDDEEAVEHYRCVMNWTEADLPGLLEMYRDLLAVDPDQIPTDDMVKLRTRRVRRLKELKAPEFVIRNECCSLMEELALREFCAAKDVQENELQLMEDDLTLEDLINQMYEQGTDAMYDYLSVQMEQLGEDAASKEWFRFSSAIPWTEHRKMDSLRTFQQRFESGEYLEPDEETQRQAGWIDWKCETVKMLPARLKNLWDVLKRIKEPDILDAYGVLFIHDCTSQGENYDDILFDPLDAGDRNHFVFRVRVKADGDGAPYTVYQGVCGYEVAHCKNVDDLCEYINWHFSSAEEHYAKYDQENYLSDSYTEWYCRAQFMLRCREVLYGAELVQVFNGLYRAEHRQIESKAGTFVRNSDRTVSLVRDGVILETESNLAGFILGVKAPF